MSRHDRWQQFWYGWFGGPHWFFKGLACRVKGHRWVHSKSVEHFPLRKMCLRCLDGERW